MTGRRDKRELTGDGSRCGGEDNKGSDRGGLLRTNREHEFTLGVEGSTLSVVGEQ